MKFSVFQLSRKGGRKNNEDRMGYCYSSAAAIFLLADGMGGHPQGEVAAELALQVMASMFEEDAKPELPDVGAFLTAAVMAAHRQILRHAGRAKMFDSPRTTIVAAVLQAGMVSWVHCGDSRLYLVRQGKLLARTRDHSFAERHPAAGVVLKLPKRINRNVLFTCLGSPIKPVLELTGPWVLHQGDRLLLCSDGLWSSLSEDDIAFQLSQKPVSQAVPDLVETALLKAGTRGDNVTALALEWETPDPASQEGNRISTDVLHVDFFASTFQSDLSEPIAEAMDEASMERSVAEINASIRRAAAKKA
jgi:serine/threonine protein phosphatase PrpC